MNKKAQIFEPMMAILLIILLLFAINALIYEKGAERDKAYVGETSVNLVELVNEAKLTKFLIKKTAESSYYKALEELAAQGGGYEDWSRPNIKLNQKVKFFEIFKESFDKYLKELNVGTTYVIEEKDKKLKFNSREKLWFFTQGLTSDFVSSGASYSLQHSFEIDFDYDFSIYDKLHEKYHTPLSKCPFKEKSIEELNVKVKCDDSSDEININAELTKDLMFVRPVIKFKLSLLKKAIAK